MAESNPSKRNPSVPASANATVHNAPVQAARQPNVADDVAALAHQARALAQEAQSARAPGQPTAPPFAASGETLAEIDKAIASELDNLLEGEFESIDAVLDGVFDEQAAIVQQSQSTPATLPGGAPIPMKDGEVQMVAPVPAPGIMLAQTAQPVHLLSAKAESNSTEVAARAKPEVIASVPAQAAPDVKPTPAAPIAAAVVVAEKVLPSAPASAAHADVIPSPIIEKSVSIAKSWRRFDLLTRTKSVWLILSQPIVALLQLVNSPLKFVPPKFRPLTDWTALTLLLWVPAVWIIALKVGHAPIRPPAKATHTASPAPLHEYSTNSAAPKGELDH